MDFTRITVVARNNTATTQLDAFFSEVTNFSQWTNFYSNLNRQYKCFRQYIDSLQVNIVIIIMQSKLIENV